MAGSPPQTHESLSGANTALLQRITEGWEEDDVTWNNQPQAHTVNQVTLAKSTSPTQDYLDIEVTNIVQDMVDNPSSNYGFLFRLETEEYYRRMCFAASNHTDPALRPTLVITYESCSIDIGNDTTFCFGDELILTPGPDYVEYLWQDGSTAPTFLADTTGLYWVEITDASECVARDSIYISTHAPDLNIPPLVSICDGEPAVLDAGEGFTRYLWSTGDTTSSIIVNNPGFFSVTVEDEYGCVASKEIEVDVASAPEINLPEFSSVCYGSSTLLDAGNTYASYDWSTGETTRQILVSDPGNYWLRVTNAGGCENSDTTEVLQNPQPEFFSIDNSSTGTIVLEGIGGTPPYGYTLGGGDYQTSNEFNDLLPGSYRAYIRDMNGCENDTLATVSEVPLDIPNFFTPNGDNTHDIWEIGNIDQFPEAIIMIFDRYGKLLYSYYGNETGWDGTYQNKAIESDTYWYQITFNDGSPSIAGDVTIKR